MREKSTDNKIVLNLLLIIILFATVSNVHAQSTDKSERAKYVFLFIGDGMGPAQVKFGEIFLRLTSGDKDKKLVFSDFKNVGITGTASTDSYITDSAAAGTAIACGYKTKSQYIGVGSDRKTRFRSIAEIARDNGWKVGVITSVSLDHATPASFYAHQPSRRMYREIASDLVKSGFDFFGGGGFLRTSETREKYCEILRQKGYFVVNKLKDLDKAVQFRGKKIAAIAKILDMDKAMPYVIDGLNDSFSLSILTDRCIKSLFNKKGFFMMVEGGKIDWACHANDAATVGREMLDFNDSIKIAVDFYRKHPEDTLIVVTADHECGGMALGRGHTGYRLYPELLLRQKISFLEFDKLIKRTKKSGRMSFRFFLNLVKEKFGLEYVKGISRQDMLDKSEYKTLQKVYRRSMNGETRQILDDYGYVILKKCDLLTAEVVKIISNKSGIGWTSGKHSGVPVTTYAIGKGCEMFGGTYENTAIFNKILLITQLKKD